MEQENPQRHEPHEKLVKVRLPSLEMQLSQMERMG